MNINIKAINIETTEAIKDYITKKANYFQKVLNQDDFNIFVEISKTTNHHKNGLFYKTQFNIKLATGNFIANKESEDLYNSIDTAQEDIVRQIKENKERKQTLFTRGARSVKKMLKGISKRNPFTSKYD